MSTLLRDVAKATGFTLAVLMATSLAWWLVYALTVVVMA